MKKLTRFALSTALIASAAPAFAETPVDAPSAPAPTVPAETLPAMSAQDLVTMPRLGAPVVSADGKHAIYGVTQTDPESYARSTHFFLRDLANPGNEAQEISLKGSAWDLAFGPDSQVYFLSDRAIAGVADRGYARLWRAALGADGVISAPTVVLDPGVSIDGFHLAPDGKKVVYWAAVSRDCEAGGCEDSGTAHLPGPGTGRLYEGDGGFYRHWDQWETPGTFSRAFVFGLENGKAVGDATPLDGSIEEPGAVIGDTPTKPFGGGEEIAWSSDSKGVWFVARQAGASEPYSTNTDIWWNDLKGGAPVNITAGNQATDTLPVPSPNGKYLAYLAMARPGYESDRLVIQLRDLKSGKTRALTQNFDRSFHSLAWTPDSKWLIATAQDVLDTPAFRIDPRSGAVTRLDLMAGNEAHIGAITPLPKGDLLFTRDAISSPAELYLSKGMEQARPLTNEGVKVLSGRAAIKTTRFSFASPSGDTVWGQITRLADQKGPIPAILYVHGGPQGSFNDGWSSRWNPRVVASQGYAVISVDFHGSTGYGQAFTDAINRDWGGKPLEDLQSGLAAALALDPQIDGTRACAMGASYGGYMMNWIAGQWPDRFNCLVQHDGLFDMRSFYYTTEELWFPKWDFGGSYADQKALYEQWNPVNHIDKWKTPMLVITGEKDFRVPYSQGLQSFTVLQERGIPSQMLVFPDENHWVLKPKNSLQWHSTVFDWLGRWLKAPADPAE